MNNSIKLSSAFLALFALITFATAQGQSLSSFFDDADALLMEYVEDGAVDYLRISADPEFARIITNIGQMDLSAANAAETQAFYINAYNLLVIKGVTDNLPLKSVLDVNGFFKQKKYRVAGQNLSLEQLEQDRLVKVYGDARFHFVLVCGAIGCPPLTNFAYRPAMLETQLDQQTRRAINDPVFLRVDAETGAIGLSHIFDWYQKDFGGSGKAVLNFINQYRETPLSADAKTRFYPYDWSLNTAHQLPASTSKASKTDPDRYIASAAIQSGNTETKIFSNLYTQHLNEESRSTFFTTQLSFLYGVRHNLNLGFDLRYRRVTNGPFADSPLAVLGRGEAGQSRAGITNIGPKLRWAPSKAWPNFSIQTSLGFGVGRDLEGSATQPYIDWQGATSWTQIFNDFPIGDKFSVFTEIDLLLEDFGFGKADNFNRFSTPASVILSYYPTKKLTFYGLVNASPFWTPTLDYFAQVGGGAKYNFSNTFGIEVLATKFTNAYLQQNNGQASTISFGLRISK